MIWSDDMTNFAHVTLTIALMIMDIDIIPILERCDQMFTALVGIVTSINQVICISGHGRCN